MPICIPWTPVPPERLQLSAPSPLCLELPFHPLQKRFDPKMQLTLIAGELTHPSLPL